MGSCYVLEGPNRQTRQLISFSKENTVCFTVKQCDLSCQLKIIVIFLYTRATI